jgi:hypothetical protein
MVKKMSNKKGQDGFIAFLLLLGIIILLIWLFIPRDYEKSIKQCKLDNYNNYTFNTTCFDGSIKFDDYKEFPCTKVNFDKLNDYCNSIIKK